VCAEVAASSAFSLLAFLVDTASELLPKRFGGQGLGQAKRTSTMNGPEMSSPWSAFAEGYGAQGKSEKAKTIRKGKLS
jgi:hypothetical protein